MFEIFSIKFNNREAFNTALSFLENSKYDGFFHDIGYSDMIISFGDKSVLNDFVSELSVSSAHFTINQ
tara:strand:- start:255 stop:458 length:204 start_codon:yes stop_codon:yes gene_type:complete